jgi:hypothetical protein
MIVSKSQSQATLPEECSRQLTSAQLAITSFIIHYLGGQTATGFWITCPRSRLFAQVDCRC